jgi:hypothetical protein
LGATKYKKLIPQGLFESMCTESMCTESNYCEEHVHVLVHVYDIGLNEELHVLAEMIKLFKDFVYK